MGCGAPRILRLPQRQMLVEIQASCSQKMARTEPIIRLLSAERRGGGSGALADVHATGEAGTPATFFLHHGSMFEAALTVLTPGGLTLPGPCSAEAKAVLGPVAQIYVPRIPGVSADFVYTPDQFGFSFEVRC